ncbi:MAG: ABC transporter permease [Actinomycetes bacterium]
MSGAVVRVVTIAGTELRRFLRDRSNVFFVFVLPLLLVVLIGLQFGDGARPTLLVAVPAGADDTGAALLAAVERQDAVIVELVEDVPAARDDVARGRADAAVLLDDDLDAVLAAGGSATVGFVSRPDGTGAAIRTVASRAVAAVSVDLEGAATLAPVAVETRVLDAGLAGELSSLGQFDLGASSQLVLFVFVTSLAGSAALIQLRQWGIATRVRSTPTSTTELLVGQAVGRTAIALVQAGYIVAGTLVLFDVRYGDPLAVAVVVGAFCVVSAGAAMLLGAVSSNDAQAGGLGVGLGLGLAALGGAMAPIEVFPPVMQRVALATPHAWALDAFAELQRRDGRLGDVLGQVGVLAGFAAVLLALAVWRLHRVTVRA